MISCWHDFFSRVVLLGSHFTVDYPMGYLPAFKKEKKTKERKVGGRAKNICPHLESHCRAPSSLEVEGFPVAPGRSEGIWCWGGCWRQRKCQTTSPSICCPSSKWPWNWEGKQIPQILECDSDHWLSEWFLLPLSFLSSFFSEYQSINMFIKCMLWLGHPFSHRSMKSR